MPSFLHPQEYQSYGRRVAGVNVPPRQVVPLPYQNLKAGLSLAGLFVGVVHSAGKGNKARWMVPWGVAGFSCPTVVIALALWEIYSLPDDTGKRKKTRKRRD